jgi:hypothetical protein
MDTVNVVMTRLFDGLLWPFRGLHPMWGLTAVSVLTGIAMVWLFGKVSNQRLIGSLKRRIKGHLLEMWLFRDSTLVVLKAQGRVLWNTLKYALCALQALVVLMIPVIFIMIQLEARYGSRPLRPGEKAVVKIVYAAPKSLEAMDVKIEVPEGLAIETPPLRIPGEREVDFRVGARAAGDYVLRAKLGDGTVTKAIRVGSPGGPLSPVRSTGLLSRFLHPAEPGLPDGPLEAVEVAYPASRVSLWGMEFHWLWPFFILSIVTGYALKGVFKVEL